MILGFLASSYPRAVDTAVRNEVLGLRELGHTVHTFAIRRAEVSQLVSDLHHRELATTTYIVSDHMLAAVGSTLRLLVRSPKRFWRTLALAVRTHPPGIRGFLLQLAYFVEASFLAEQLLERGIQHFHNHIGENSASVAMLASSLSGVPYSLTIHGPYIFRAPERWALGEKIVRSAFTVAITHFTQSQCMMYIPYEHWNKLRVIRCGPEVELLACEPPPLPDVRRLIWVGRICEEKGVPLLLEAAAQLADEKLEFELVMVGEGPLRAETERQIRERQLEGRIEITGWLSGEAVRDQIARCRAMVLPSFAEGLPAVLMESLALGRPAVSTFIAGIPELIEPGRNGWLVPAGSCEALAAAMREAIELPDETIERMGAAGRRLALQLHNTTVEVGKLEQCIRESVEAGSPAD